MMDLRQLRYFVAIVEQGSFSRAAEVLRVAQPALSLHVRNMEADLGTQLLFRSPRGVEPTEAGTTLLRHARIILDQFTVAEQEIRGQQNDPAGEVRLGVPGTIGQFLAVPLITAVHQRYPKIKLRIAEAMSGFILEWMREERVNIAVLYGEAKGHGIRTERLLEEDLQFFGPATSRDDHPPLKAISFADATQMPLILPGKGHGLRELINQTSDAMGLSLTPIIDVDSYGNIKSLVEAGFGYSILPENAISSEITEGRLRSWTITDPPISRSIHLAHSENRPMTNAVSVVLDLIRETLCDLTRNGSWIGARIAVSGD